MLNITVVIIKSYALIRRCCCIFEFIFLRTSHMNVRRIDEVNRKIEHKMTCSILISIQMSYPPANKLQQKTKLLTRMNILEWWWLILQEELFLAMLLLIVPLFEYLFELTLLCIPLYSPTLWYCRFYDIVCSRVISSIFATTF